jgi:hypothetical protein
MNCVIKITDLKYNVDYYVRWQKGSSSVPYALGNRAQAFIFTDIPTDKAKLQEYLTRFEGKLNLKPVVMRLHQLKPGRLELTIVEVVDQDTNLKFNLRAE